MDKLFVVTFRILLCLIQAMVMMNHSDKFTRQDIDDKLNEAKIYITPVREYADPLQGAR